MFQHPIDPANSRTADDVCLYYLLRRDIAERAVKLTQAIGREFFQIGPVSLLWEESDSLSDFIDVYYSDPKTGIVSREELPYVVDVLLRVEWPIKQKDRNTFGIMSTFEFPKDDIRFAKAQRVLWKHTVLEDLANV